MNIEKSILTLYILCFIGFGFPGVLLPDQFAALLQYKFITPAGKTEFVAAYGGLIIGIGLYLIYCLKTNVRGGLVCVAITLASLFVGRVIGLFTGGDFDDIQLTFLTLELVSLLLIGFVLITKQPCTQAIHIQ